MDNSIISKHLEVINKHYPNMNITQLGLVSLYLGIIRSAMGHEFGQATVDNYIHPKYLSKDVRKCLDYLEREVLGLKRSKMDIDYYKIGNRSKLRREKDKVETSKNSD